MPPPTTAFLVPTSAELTIELATQDSSALTVARECYAPGAFVRLPSALPIAWSP